MECIASEHCRHKLVAQVRQYSVATCKSFSSHFLVTPAIELGLSGAPWDPVLDLEPLDDVDVELLLGLFESFCIVSSTSNSAKFLFSSFTPPRNITTNYCKSTALNFALKVIF